MQNSCTRLNQIFLLFTHIEVFLERGNDEFSFRLIYAKFAVSVFQIVFAPGKEIANDANVILCLDLFNFSNHASGMNYLETYVMRFEIYITFDESQEAHGCLQIQ